jgi:hypothetical protein
MSAYAHLISFGLSASQLNPIITAAFTLHFFPVREGMLHITEIVG